MDIPFEVGGRYRNRLGEYEVLSIDGNKMTIRYDHGHVQTVGVAVQTQIWQSIQDEEAQPPSPITNPRKRADSSQATAPIRELVEDVLRERFSAPYPSDITDQVCLAIEGNEDWLSRYWSLVEHFSQSGKKGRDIVNNWIGTYTKDLTGMVVVISSVKAKSDLIQTYSKLGYGD
jgi:hypothetical protein